MKSKDTLRLDRLGAADINITCWKGFIVVEYKGDRRSYGTIRQALDRCLAPKRRKKCSTGS